MSSQANVPLPFYAAQQVTGRPIRVRRHDRRLVDEFDSIDVRYCRVGLKGTIPQLPTRRTQSTGYLALGT